MSEVVTPIRSDPPGRLTGRDVLAGLSVALIFIPQSMAYAELAGAYTLAEMLQRAEGAGLEVRLEDVPEHASRVLAAIGLQPGPAPRALGRPGGRREHHASRPRSVALET